ncbi:hypothetical protein HD554DRAFT_1828863 [Boletus coccyginus]|nr:hypothetical protein HD554DRAFT_1828863 [Boletus coccyginus]
MHQPTGYVGPGNKQAALNQSITGDRINRQAITDANRVGSMFPAHRDTSILGHECCHKDVLCALTGIRGRDRAPTLLSGNSPIRLYTSNMSLSEAFRVRSPADLEHRKAPARVSLAPGFTNADGCSHHLHGSHLVNVGINNQHQHHLSEVTRTTTGRDSVKSLHCQTCMIITPNMHSYDVTCDDSPPSNQYLRPQEPPCLFHRT